MKWPRSYWAANRRRHELIDRGDDLTQREREELRALTAMIDAWVDSRYPFVLQDIFDDLPISV